jgi:hypothetical protein
MQNNRMGSRLKTSRLNRLAEWLLRSLETGKVEFGAFFRPLSFALQKL